jgi:hypothetical protein
VTGEDRAGTVDPKRRLRVVLGRDHRRAARDSSGDGGGLRCPRARV